VIGRRRVVRAAVAVGALLAGVGVGVALAGGSGGLDPSFGTGGTTVFERPTSTYPTPAELAPGGKIVVVSTSGGVITVSRLLSNGAPDPTFCGGSPATIHPEGFPSAYAVAVQSDGKIILVGFRNVNEGKGEVAMVWRLKADGGSGAPNDALDPTFGTNGAVEINTFTYTVAAAVAIQPDGKIVVAGSGFSGTAHNKVAVWRVTTNGALDVNFDNKGTAEISDGKEDSVNAIALQPDGKIVLAGSTSLALPANDAVVWRLKGNGGSGEINGALDPTFDVDGQADVDSGGSEIATAVALQPDGKIVIAGYTEKGPLGYDAMVWRLKANGGVSNLTNDALDSTFGKEGAAPIGGGVFARAAAVALQPDGKILVAGGETIGAISAAVIWRLAASGGTGEVNSALDPTFGSGGAATVKAGAYASASALALQPDRRIIAAGPGLGENLLVFRALGDPFALNVAKAGTGSGTVQSSPAGITCGVACSGPFEDGTGVTLSASPGAGSAFAGWSGAGCRGAGSCALTMSADQTVTATFNTLPLTPPTPPTPPPTKATISGLGESNSTFTVGPSSTPLTGQTSAKRHKRGTVFSFQLDQAATVTIAIQTKAPGRRVARSCRTDSRTLRHKPRCTRTITIATLTRSAHAGLNKVAFSGRVRGKALTPGRYQVAFTAADSAGESPSKTLSFAIVRR
jgi:uncharacterized delta-60 repeat protein